VYFSNASGTSFQPKRACSGAWQNLDALRYSFTVGILPSLRAVLAQSRSSVEFACRKPIPAASIPAAASACCNPPHRCVSTPLVTPTASRSRKPGTRFNFFAHLWMPSTTSSLVIGLLLFVSLLLLVALLLLIAFLVFDDFFFGVN
jgi:hypothetical protein